jgi:hypothetical protein
MKIENPAGLQNNFTELLPARSSRREINRT